MVDFCECFEGVFLMSAEEGAMGTQFCAIIDADNFYFLLVIRAELDLVGVCTGTGDGIPRGLLLIRVTVVQDACLFL